MDINNLQRTLPQSYHVDAGRIRERLQQADVDALKVRFEEKEGVKTDTFDSYVNKMAFAYQLLKDRIEEKYAASGLPCVHGCGQ